MSDEALKEFSSMTGVISVRQVNSEHLSPKRNFNRDPYCFNNRLARETGHIGVLTQRLIGNGQMHEAGLHSGLRRDRMHALKKSLLHKYEPRCLRLPLGCAPG